MVWAELTPGPTPATWPGSSNVEVSDGEGILLDEFAARFDDIAHQAGEDLVGHICLRDLDPQQRPIGGVQSGLPQLLGIHFTEAFVTLDRETAASCSEHCIEQLGGSGYRNRLALGLGLFDFGLS